MRPYPTEALLPTAIMALNPVGYWKLDDPTTASAVDSSGFNRNGTYAGATAQNITGGDGLLYSRYNGSTSASGVSVPTNAAFNIGTTGITVFFLFNATNYTVAPSFMSRPTMYRSDVTATTATGAGLTSGGVTARQSAGSSAFSTTTWYAMAYTFPVDPAYPTITVNNSTLVTTPTGAGVTNPTATTTLNIGRGTTATNARLVGGMAHACIFQTILSPTQITSLMDAADADGWY